MCEDRKSVAAVLEKGIRRMICANYGGEPLTEEIPPDMVCHEHGHREILYVIDGECNYQLGKNWYHLTPGDAIFIDSWQTHSFFYRQSDSNLTHLWFSIHRQKLSVNLTRVESTGRVQRRMLYVEAPQIATHLLSVNWDRARGAKAENSGFYHEQLKLAFALMLNEMIFAYLSEDENVERSKSENLIDYIADYIEVNHGKDCSLSQLEKLSGYTHCYLSHLFRKYYGKTIGAAINEARMRYVVEQSWMASTKDIADELGFSSVMTFWRWRRNNHHLEEIMSNKNDR